MSRGRVYLILGVVLAVVSGFMVFLTINAAKPKPVQTVPVLIANETIPPRTYVTSDNVKTLFIITNWPVDIAPAGILSEPGATLDHVVVGGMEKGTPVFMSDLSSLTTQGQTGLSIEIPTNMEAVSIPITQVNAVGGAIAPGDFVDLLVSIKVDPNSLVPTNAALVSATPAAGSAAQPTPTPKPTATPAAGPAAAAPAGGASNEAASLLTLTTLQHVKVVAVGQQLDTPKVDTSTSKGSAAASSSTNTAAPTTLTLLLSPQDALIVKYARDSGAMIDLALRRYDDQSPFATKGVDLQYFLDHYGYHLIAAPAGTPAPGTTRSGG